MQKRAYSLLEEELLNSLHKEELMAVRRGSTEKNSKIFFTNHIKKLYTKKILKLIKKAEGDRKGNT